MNTSKPPTTFEPNTKAVPGSPFKTLLRYNAPYWKRYAIGAALSLFGTIIGLGLPLLVRAIVLGFEENRMTMPLLLACFSGIVAVAGVAGIARYFQRLLMIGASRLFEYDLRSDYFAHVQFMSRSFFHRNSTGDIMARASNDINYVRELIGPGIMGTVDIIRVPFTLGMMLFLSVKLTLIAMIPLPIVSILVYALMRFMNKQSKIVQELFGEVTALVQENLAGARVVKAYGIADREQEKLREISTRYMRENIKLVAVLAFAWPLIGLLSGAIIILIVWRGGGMVINNVLSLGDLTAFMFYTIMLAIPLAQFGWVLTLYQRGAASMERINKVFADIPEVIDPFNPVEFPEKRGRAIVEGQVSFNDVSFAYGERPILNHVSFEIHPGKTLALVGRTGSGKSTVVSLLTREYDPTDGQILLDGIDLRDIPIRQLRGVIGYVPQDTFIFSDTIRENIRIGRADAGDDEIMEACRNAQFDEALSRMPQGLDSLLGERGINLSGGQRQRLALARAILCDPAILILDDSLAAVDTHTEEEILKRLDKVMHMRTTILISHRISTVKRADHILVLEDGQIIEEGNHESLLLQDGVYAAMHQRQLLETVLDET